MTQKRFRHRFASLSLSKRRSVRANLYLSTECGPLICQSRFNTHRFHGADAQPKLEVFKHLLHCVGMDPTFLLPRLESGVCKWCGLNTAEIGFENAQLCHICYKKALDAFQNPRLCHICTSLATDATVLEALFSEDGYSHDGFGYLEKSAESGCGLCRLLLLQDPNPNWQRVGEPLTLFAERKKNVDKSVVGDINSLYFSSEQEMFTLKLSVSAAERKTSSAS